MLFIVKDKTSPLILSTLIYINTIHAPVWSFLFFFMNVLSVSPSIGIILAILVIITL